MAFACGIALDDFWRMTPWQLGIAVEARNQRDQNETESRLGIAWYTAAFSRMTKLPPLREVLNGGKKPQVKRIDERAIMAQLKKYAAMQKGAGNDGRTN